MTVKLNIKRVPLPHTFNPAVSALQYQTEREEVTESKGSTQVIQKVLEHNITVYRNEEVLAWVSFCARNEALLYVRNRYMKEEEACSELEKSLLAYIESWAKENGFQSILVHANVHCQAFYRTHGFVPLGDEFMEVGTLHRKMQKPLFLH